MADFDAKLKKLQSLLSAEEECCTELGKIQDDISGVRNNLTFQLDVSATIKSQLGRIHTHVGTQKRGVSQLKQGLDQTVRQYDRTETRICHASEDGKISTEEAVKGSWHRFKDWVDSKNFPRLPFMPGAIGPCVAVIDFIMSDDTKWTAKVDRGWNSEKKDIKKQYIRDGKGLRKLDPENPEDKKILDQIKEDKPEKVATIFSKETKAEGNLWKTEGEAKNDHASVKGSVSVGSGEVHAGVYGGVYTVGADGKKKLSPGFGAEAGGSFTAFSAEGEAALGNDDLGAYVKGNVDAGKVEAKAGVDVGLTDKNGKFNPTVYAGASAEAIAIEASAALGARLLGTDVSGNVGVNVGVGAHAKVGMKDGVINLDIGASVGVGVSANLSIDVSKTIEEAGAYYSKAKSAFSNAGKAVGQAAQKMQKFFNW